MNVKDSEYKVTSVYRIMRFLSSRHTVQAKYYEVSKAFYISHIQDIQPVAHLVYLILVILDIYDVRESLLGIKYLW